MALRRCNQGMRNTQFFDAHPTRHHDGDRTEAPATSPAPPWEPLKIDQTGTPRVPWSWWDSGQDGRDR